MKITMYELLGMIKDGKAPKKILFLGNTYRYDEINKTYRNILGNTNIGEMHNLEFYLDDEVEILEEEKKIPEKLPYYSLEKIQKAKNKDEWREERISLLEKRVEDLHIKINEIIDYLKSKGE